MRVCLTDRNSAIYELNESVRFCLSFRARKAVEKVSLRFEIRSADDASVGTSFLFDAISLKDNEEADINLCFDTIGLIPGKYYVVLGTFEKNQFGTYTDIDVVENAFGFEIKDEKNALGIVWLRKYWGHMKLNDITFEQ